MIEKEFLTIKEVAEIAGVSVQAVYNRVEKDFKPYLKIENGKKWLNKAVLKHFKIEKHSTDFNENFKLILNLVERQNEQLQRELEIKNKQIEALTEALEKAQNSVQAEQALHAGTLAQISEHSEQSAELNPKKKKRWWRR